jgi:thiol:disulfide interchange protein DsbC
MNKIIFSFLALVILLHLEAHSVYAQDPCSDISLDTIRAHAPVPPKAEIISRKNTGGICEVILSINGEPVPLYVSKDFIIAGEMYSNKVQITRESLESVSAVISELKHEMAKKLAEDFLAIRDNLDTVAGITYTPEGKKNHTLYMISSPSCPYCNKAAKEIQPILDETGTQLKIIFQADGPARDKAAEAICQKIDLQTYNSNAWQSKSSEKACDEGVEIVHKSSTLAQQLGVRGVPTFFLEDGSQVVGANMLELKKLLSAN